MRGATPPFDPLRTWPAGPMSEKFLPKSHQIGRLVRHSMLGISMLEFPNLRNTSKDTTSVDWLLISGIPLYETITDYFFSRMQS